MCVATLVSLYIHSIYLFQPCRAIVLTTKIRNMPPLSYARIVIYLFNRDNLSLIALYITKKGVSLEKFYTIQNLTI